MIRGYTTKVATLALIAGIAMVSTACTSAKGPATKAPARGEVLEVAGDDSALSFAASPQGKEVLEAMRQDTGISLTIKDAEQRQAVRKIAGGAGESESLAVTWYASNVSFAESAQAQARIAAENNTTRVPVAMAIRRARAAELGWSANAPTLSAVRDAAANGKYRFAVANPVISEAGSAVALALANDVTTSRSGGGALEQKEVEAKLRATFNAARYLANGSIDASKRFQSDKSIDVLFGLENDLLTLAKAGDDPIDVIVPAGAQPLNPFPLTLMSGASPATQTRYGKVAAWLTSAKGQSLLASRGLRRTVTDSPESSSFKPPVVPGSDAKEARELLPGLLREFPSQIQRERVTAFVIDRSSSAYGEQLVTVAAGMGDMTCSDSSMPKCVAGGDTVILVAFNHETDQPVLLRIPRSWDAPERDKIRRWANGLAPLAGSAPFDALAVAHEAVAAELAKNPAAYGSVVLASDGVRNRGLTGPEFLTKRQQTPQWQPIVTNVAIFGKTPDPALRELSTQSGGAYRQFREGGFGKLLAEFRKST